MTAVTLPSWPIFGDAERAAVDRVLRSGRVNYWTGDEGRTFEAEYAALIGRRHAIALANGTVALELALHGFGIGAGDEVVTSSRTFIASASAAVACGAVPVCADVDRDSQNVTADSIERVLTPRTRAIIVVHLAGWPCDMPAIMALAKRHGLRVIEDCAQAHGARLDGRPVGSWGDAAAFSFCQDKIITTGGEGGLLALDDDDAFERAWAYKDHGKSYDAVHRRQHAPGFRWLHESFGTNWRMTEIQAAIGRVALRLLPEWVAQRRRNAETLASALADLSILRIPMPPRAVDHAYYRFYAFVRPEFLAVGATRDSIMADIHQSGVPCAVGSCSEIYRERAFVERGWGPPEFHPVARELGDTSLAFLVHPTLAESHMHAASIAIRAALQRASR